MPTKKYWWIIIIIIIINIMNCKKSVSTTITIIAFVFITDLLAHQITGEVRLSLQRHTLETYWYCSYFISKVASSETFFYNICFAVLFCFYGTKLWMVCFFFQY